MKQVMVIHGGTTFEKYEDFISHLLTKKVLIERLTYKPLWKERLQEDLGNNYQVLLPSMPNKANARYSEWKLWFTRLTEVLEDDSILIGHSLGAIFLAKYLSEERVAFKPSATILIAGPYDDDSEEDLTDFKITSLNPLFTKQAGELTFIHGSDDPVIPITEVDKYKREAPEATYITLPAPDHFMRESLPELIQVIKQVG